MIIINIIIIIIIIIINMYIIYYHMLMIIANWASMILIPPDLGQQRQRGPDLPSRLVNIIVISRLVTIVTVAFTKLVKSWVALSLLSLSSSLSLLLIIVTAWPLVRPQKSPPFCSFKQKGGVPRSFCLCVWIPT